VGAASSEYACFSIGILRKMPLEELSAILCKSRLRYLGEFSELLRNVLKVGWVIALSQRKGSDGWSHVRSISFDEDSLRG